MSKQLFYKAARNAALLGASMAMRRRGKRGPVRRRGPKTRRGIRTKRRIRSRTKTTRKRKRSITDARADDLTYLSANYGRKMRPSLKSAWRVLRSNLERIVFSYRNLSPFGGIRGAVDLYNGVPTGGTTLFCPVHSYEITAVNNFVNNALTTGTVFRRLQFDTQLDTGVASWPAMGSLVVENTSGATTSVLDAYPNGRSLLKWMSAKMMFYAPTNASTKLTIEVVRFTDSRLVPGSGDNSVFNTAFWQYMTKKYIYNPIEPLNTKYRRYVKVMKRINIIMDGKDTTEVGNTRYKEVNIFMNLNKTCVYDWENDDRVNLTNSDFQTNIGENNTRVYPTSRMFLLVRGQCQAGVTFNTAIHPSYDIVFRVQHEQLSM